MRTFGYWLGIVLLLAGAAVGVAEILAILQGAPSTTLSFGSMWYRIHANSLVGFQALVEKSISPLLWPPVQFLLTIPAWLILIPPGLVLVIACWPRSRH